MDASFCPGCGQKRVLGHGFCPGCGQAFVVPASRPHVTGKDYTHVDRFNGCLIIIGIALVVGVLALILRPSLQTGINGISLVTPPAYQSQIINVPALSQSTFTMSGMTEGGTFEGSFVITGGSDDIGFAVQSPSGGYVLSVPRVQSHYDFRVSPTVNGTYVLVFDNHFSLLTPKTISLTYRGYN